MSSAAYSNVMSVARPNVGITHDSSTPSTRANDVSNNLVPKGWSLLPTQSPFTMVPATDAAAETRDSAAPYYSSASLFPFSNENEQLGATMNMDPDVHVMRRDPELPQASLMAKYMYSDDEARAQLLGATDLKVACLSDPTFERVSKTLASKWFAQLDRLGWFWVLHLNLQPSERTLDATDWCDELRATCRDSHLSVLTENAYYSERVFKEHHDKFEALHTAAKTLLACVDAVKQVPYGLDRIYDTSALTDTLIPNVARAFYAMVTCVMHVLKHIQDFETFETRIIDGESGDDAETMKKRGSLRHGAYLAVVLHANDGYFGTLTHVQCQDVSETHPELNTYIDAISTLIDPFEAYTVRSSTLDDFLKGVAAPLYAPDGIQGVVQAQIAELIQNDKYKSSPDEASTQESRLRTVQNLLKEQNVASASYSGPSSKMHAFFYGPILRSSKPTLTLHEVDELLDKEGNQTADYVLGNVDFLLRDELMAMWDEGRYANAPRHVSTSVDVMDLRSFKPLQNTSRLADDWTVRLLGTWDASDGSYHY